MNSKLCRAFRLALFGLLVSSQVAEARFSDKLCKDPNYECYRVQRGDSWESLWPNWHERDLVQQVNRMNTRLTPGIRIAVPKGWKYLSLMDLSPFPYQVDNNGRKLVVFSPRLLAFGAYDEFGQLVRWGAASGGQNYCPDLGKPCKTIVGSFAFYHKRGIDCISNKFPLPDGGAEMPYCMFFKGGFAMHASEFVPGHNASHGCIRIFYADAEWLHEEFIDIYYPSKGRSTKVIVLPY